MNAAVVKQCYTLFPCKLFANEKFCFEYEAKEFASILIQNIAYPYFWFSHFNCDIELNTIAEFHL